MNKIWQEKKYTVLIIYDIVEDKRRSKMVKCLEQYAHRVQKSAFEGQLTEKQYKKLVTQAPRYISKQTDSLRIYIHMPGTQVTAWGKKEKQEPEIIIV